MDPHLGPGPWTTFMDRVHGPPVMDKNRTEMNKNRSSAKIRLKKKHQQQTMLDGSVHYSIVLT